MRLLKHPALALIVSLLFALPSVADAMENAPRVFRLQNGLTILVREDDRFPLVSVRLFVRAGSAWETPEESGISHFLEHMVFKGSKTRADGVDKLVEGKGGSLNASTSYDETVYETNLPAAEWRTALAAVRDLAFDPLLRPDDLEAERKVVLAEMRQRGDNPYTRLYHAVFALALEGTPYQRPVIGSEETLNAVTPESMRAYIQRRYDPRDMALSVAGRVSADEVLAEAEKLFGSYRNANVEEAAARIAPRSLAHGLRAEVKEGPWNKAYICLAFPLPGEGAPGLPAVDVLAHILGGDDTAILPRELHFERHVVDAILAGAFAYERAGLFVIAAQVDADKQEEFVRMASERLAALVSPGSAGVPWTDAELARARLNLEDNFLRGQETVAEIAETTGSLYFADPSDPAGEHYLEALRLVDREQVRAVAAEWLRPDALSVVALSPRRENGKPVTADSLIAAVKEGWPAARDAAAPKTAPIATKDAGLPQPERVDLGNGRMVVLEKDDSLPYVSATLLFSGGEILADKEHEGLASVTADLLTSGSGGKSRAEISELLAGRASGLSASSGITDFAVSLDAPSRFSADVFDLLRAAVTSPAFAEDELARVKRDHLANIASLEDNVMGVLQRNLRHVLFPDSPYGHRPEGTKESLDKLTRQNVLDFWASQSARPWVLSVVGDFDREAVLAFARTLPAPSAPKAVSAPPVWAATKEVRLSLPERDQAAYLMLFPTVPIEDKDSGALQLLSASLDGFGGMLFQELREKRSLCYSVTPINWAGEDAGFLAFSILAAPEYLEPIHEEFVHIAADLHKQPLAEGTIERAKAGLFTQYYTAQQRRAARAAQYARLELRGRPLDYGKKRLDEVEKLNADDLRRVASTWLVVPNAYSLAVTP